MRVSGSGTSRSVHRESAAQCNDCGKVGTQSEYQAVEIESPEQSRARGPDSIDDTADVESKARGPDSVDDTADGESKVEPLIQPPEPQEVEALPPGDAPPVE